MSTFYMYTRGMITASIDLCLIDQSKCKKMVRKRGPKACSADIVLIETPDGKYGDWMVKQDFGKEARESGVQSPILGSGKNRGKRPPAPRATDEPAPALPDDDPDDIPF